MNRFSAWIFVGAFVAGGTSGWAQQMAVPQIDLMPNLPSPYSMRDWRSVVLAYDSLVFNESLSGPFLPLVEVAPNGVNYPSSPAFRLHTYVGTNSPSVSEAINGLPALVGATLAGHDMRSFLGRDWVNMSRDWFNDRISENVYLNGPSATSGDDWWYETMPNVFFYQLASLYPPSEEVNRQFRLVADRWWSATRAMGGRIAPWSVPNMSHRAWRLSTMTPNDVGVPEPESAGAIGWLLYMAYLKTGETRYRIGAEWAMEALNGLSSNPSYELQLSYGVQTAARMNAELGTNYDLTKLLGWCFDIGPLRSWGALVGSSGGRDYSGLIGEVNGENDYAFAMNTFQQIAALAPVARYDERFARALGKWILNASNASRMFYSAYLPDSLQDSGSWVRENDPRSVVAYEALRQTVQGSGPFATGDAVAGGWAATNLALYGSSSVGYLAAVVETTDVPGILRFDLRATDFARLPAYPTYLFYNPHSEAKSVTISVGDSVTNIYDLVTNTNLATLVSVTTSILIPPDGAIVAALLPANLPLTYDQGRLTSGGIIVDYHSDGDPGNRFPRIKALGATVDTVVADQTIELFCTAMDLDGDSLEYAWTASMGSVLGAWGTAVWQAPPATGTVTIRCEVSDGHGGTTMDSVNMVVLERINVQPVIQRMTAGRKRIVPGDTTTVSCLAVDANGDTLSYEWSASSGTIQGTDSSVTWTAPGIAGNATIRCMVRDGYGGEDVESVAVMVRVPYTASGSLIAFYPCDGNALDGSGYGHHGSAAAVAPTMDRWGRTSRALMFDGSSSVRVPADSILNCRSAITVAFWMKVTAFPAREQYPISHGNWTNRWKVSISNQRLRWTVRTTAGVKDLDSEIPVTLDSTVHVAVEYDGSDMAVYLNGTLDAFTSWTGNLLTTPLDLTIGQALPADIAYGFIGTLDEIRVYDYALSPDEIASLPLLVTSVDAGRSILPTHHRLAGNAPNPFNPSTLISFDLAYADDVRLTIVDLLGRTVAAFDQGRRAAGRHTISWDATGLSSGVYVIHLETSEGRLLHKTLLLR